ncbi:MAG: DnaJ C-terminal domain-containing protein [Planctomycetota bacterium]|jgi:DnaJ-class molecular chaperone
MPTQDDPYQILGVSRNASADEIKNAYRKLARELHPDVNKSDDAQARFSRVQHAYDILSDPQKKSQHDKFGGVPGSAGPAGGTYSWSNVAGQNPFAESFDFEMDDLGSIFSEMFGGQSRAQRHSTRQRSRAPKKDTEHEIEIPFDLALRGGNHALRLSAGGVSQTIEVSIPKGIDDGARLRVKGKGARGADLIIAVRIAKHPLYTRAGLDLMVTLPLTMSEAALGCTVPMPTPSGAVDLTVPPATSSHSRLRLKGKGVEDAKGRRGDLYAHVRIVMPEVDALSDEDNQTLRRLGQSQPNPREGSHWHPDS